MNTKGITLIASVMLIAFASITVLGMTVFIVQRLSQNEANQITTRCVYLAQAGIHKAVYDYRYNDLSADGYFSLGQSNIDADNYFVSGGTDGDLLMVNTSITALDPPPPAKRKDIYKSLIGLTMQNATNSKAITIDRMVVTWDNSKRLSEIWINGLRVWQGNSKSPADCNITNFTLDTTPTVYGIDYLYFSGDMSGTTISIEFVMTDGSMRSLLVYPASQNYSFTVKSTGKTSDSVIYRTIQADFNALTSNITNYYEIHTEITP